MIFDRKWQLDWENCSFNICLNQGGLVGPFNSGGGCMRLGRTVKNTLNGGGIEGEETKIFKREGSKLNQEVSALKRGTGTPLRTCYI